jgi:peptide methionine sulfoxide reductase MsrA
MARCVVGYCGGREINPEYRNIKDSTESLLVEFDPKVISYQKILEFVSVATRLD